MCTALTLITKDGEHLFGRNMDIEFSFGQRVGIIPRNFEYINMSTGKKENVKNAIIGMMTIIDDHPMLADGLNEKGLAIAGLNFPNYAYLESSIKENKVNIPAYDLMLWILSNFKSIEDVKEAIQNVNLMNTQINSQALAPTLHWIVTDLSGKSIVIEKTKESFKVFNNNIGVLTNSPTFDWHINNLKQYISLGANQVESATWGNEKLLAHGEGVGAIGLPGDFTPASRFIRTAFLRNFAITNDSDKLNEMEFFHILNNVAMVRGSVRTPRSMSDITQYTSCMNQEKGLYYYNTYNNSMINVVDIHRENLNSKEIKLFNYIDTFSVNQQN